ncbi:MAG: class I SAM-dependent methyltransferase [Chloroflexi bacterium]|nr:class I SAM-dependent methyltransferase [Chloroflexota bacterium]
MTSHALSPDGLAPGKLAFLADALAAAAAVDAADRLGLFARLSTRPADVPTLVRDCAMSERGARFLLAALQSIGLVEVGADGICRAVPDVSRMKGLYTIWHRLSEAIRDDCPAADCDAPTGAEIIYPDLAPVLGTLFAPVAERAAMHLDAAGQRVLDVGAGAAPWSIALARRDPSCRVTLVDLPAVLPVAQEAVVKAGLEAQFYYVGGDFFDVDWGSASYDLAFAGNVCHLFDEAANRRILARLYEALRPGGQLAVVDVVRSEQIHASRSVALYALGLFLRTRNGQVYPFSTYVAWLRDAGYEGVERIDLTGAPPMSLITSRRPT